MSLTGASKTTVGLVQINRALNLSRQRFKGRRQPGGSVGPRPRRRRKPTGGSCSPIPSACSRPMPRRTPRARRSSSCRDSRAAGGGRTPSPGSRAPTWSASACTSGTSSCRWQSPRRLKQLRPETLMVFGGPQVPDRAEAFLRQNPVVDVACHGEGETHVSLAPRAVGRRDWAKCRASAFSTPTGAFHHRPQGPRLTDLSSHPLALPVRRVRFADRRRHRAASGS